MRATPDTSFWKDVEVVIDLAKTDSREKAQRQLAKLRADVAKLEPGIAKNRDGFLDMLVKSYNLEAPAKPALRTKPAKAQAKDAAKEQSTKQDTAAQTSGQIHLFMPYYTPKDPERAAELRDCLARNMARDEFAKVYLLVDDDTEVSDPTGKVTIIRVTSRPGYHDWIRLSHSYCPGQISILANSDIYFEDSITHLRAIFEHDPKAFVALSRYDAEGTKTVPHPNPHWSQDVWVFQPGLSPDPLLETRMTLPLGVPRCDNKIAYLFSISGYRVYNPFHFIKTIHLHETGLRYYDKKSDRTVVGGMTMVHPSETLTQPAALELEIWSENSAQYSKVKVNKTLERWSKEAAKAAKEDAKTDGSVSSAILSHDADWQYPAVTEQHAFKQMRALGAKTALDPASVYLAFPWATLIDLLHHAKHTPKRAAALQAWLDQIKPQLARYKRVVTVCQHIHMLKFASIFKDLGITDIFWTHCVKGQSHVPDHPGLQLHPFPLYPVQQLPAKDIRPFDARPHLFSFVGAQATPIYLTKSRTWILELLGAHPLGRIVDRKTWHYNKVVYNKQILASAKDGEALVDENATAEFKKVMADSIFTLCPSGTGPNSIRLWETLGSGSIPVVLADTYQHPGSDDVWAQATVSCEETPKAISTLPTRLKQMAADPALMAEKRRAGQAIIAQYGRDHFVSDIIDLMKPR